MARYHVRADGSMGVCSAKEGNCPFGDEAGTRHFTSKAEAREYSECRVAAIEKIKRRRTLRRQKTDNGKLVIGVASSAILDLTESDKVFREEGVEGYEKYQMTHMNDPLKPGIAAPFVGKMLKFNKILEKVDPGNTVDVIIASKNSPRTGLRVLKSLQNLGFPVTRSTFTSGRSPVPYLENSYDIDLFLSANKEDVHDAAKRDLPAGRIVDNEAKPGVDAHPNELRLAFDFDGILAGDSSERQFQNYLRNSRKIHDALDDYTEFEQDHAEDPIEAGPLSGLLKGFNQLQSTMESIRNGEHEGLKKLTPQERAEIERDMKDVPSIRTYIVTARGPETAERVLNTLDAHGVHVDEMSLLAGKDKTPTLETIQPDMFFDDQSKNIKSYSSVPSVHIPLGVCNPCIDEAEIQEVFNSTKGTKRLSRK